MLHLKLEPKPPVPVYRLNDTAAPGSGQFLEVPIVHLLGILHIFGADILLAFIMEDDGQKYNYRRFLYALGNHFFRRLGFFASFCPCVHIKYLHLRFGADQESRKALKAP